MIRTVKNWKQLSNVLKDSRMNPNPIAISFDNNGLESISFESWEDAFSEENE